MVQKYINSKQKFCKLKGYALCLGNITKDSTTNDTKEIALKGFLSFFSVDFNPVDNNDILVIHNTLYKIMFGLVNEIFIV